MQSIDMNTERLYPRKTDFFADYAKLAPISLFIIRAKECELFSRYVYPRPVLDIGCGEGIFAGMLFDGEIDAGIDPDEKNVKSAQKSNMYKEVYCAGAENLPFADNSFRTIISNCVLEHVQDIDRVFSEMNRVLMPGGSAYFSVVTPLFSQAMSLSDVISDKLGMKVDWGYKFLDKIFHHNYPLSESDWVKRITKSGLELKEIHPYLSVQLLHIMGISMIFSLNSFVWKKTFNRWRLFPRFYRLKTVINFIKKKYNTENKQYGCIFFVVSKKQEVE